MYFINSTETDPYFNLALEEYIFSEMNSKESFFMLWQNDNAIIVGKYQNTIEEINQDFVKAQNTKVVRRITGGGAVYHDLGNVNFSFIQEQNDVSNLDFSIFTKPVINALEKLNVKAEFNSRNDLAIEGKKFSGNSQLIRGTRVLHHGTLLFDADLEFIQKALNVKNDKIESKAIKSIRSRVTNISEHMPVKISVEEFKMMLIENMFKENELKKYELSEEELIAVKKIRDTKYSTWEWNYGKSPEYDIRKDRRYTCGGISIFMRVQQGIINNITIHGDFFGNGEIKDIENLLMGVPCREESLIRALAGIDIDYYISGLSAEELVELVAM